MSGLHSEVMKCLYKGSGLNEDLFEYNDTGDGYLIVFLDETHSFSCVLCACHLREFLAKHLREFNHKLCLDESSLRYSFGIGLHRSTVRVMSLKAKTPNGNSLNKKIIIGNAANSAGRVESITKNSLDIDLLITGYTRQEARKECGRNYKHLFDKHTPYLNQIGGRHNIGDGKSNGHNLYSITSEFYDEYKRITG
jgi:class 3 adenylate cyclase